MALWGCFHLMEFEFEFVVYFGRGGRVLKSGLTFANPLYKQHTSNTEISNLLYLCLCSTLMCYAHAAQRHLHS